MWRMAPGGRTRLARARSKAPVSSKQSRGLTRAIRARMRRFSSWVRRGMSDCGFWIADCGLRIADFRLRMGQATGRCFRCGGDLRRIGRDHRLQPFDFAQGLRHRRVPVAVRLVLRRWPWSRGQDTGSRDGWQIWRGVVCRKDFPKVGWLLTQAAACALRAACSKLSVSRPLGCRKVGVGGATPFGFCRKEAKKQRSKGCRGRKIQTAMGPLLPPAEY